MTTGLRFSTVNIGAPDVIALARFYERLLGWRIEREHPDFTIIRDPTGGVSLSCQLEEGYVPPVWPARPGDQQMQLHLEIAVRDLEASVAHALDCGATLAEFQPQDDVRVCLDPVGHPFCLWVET